MPCLGLDAFWGPGESKGLRTMEVSVGKAGTHTGRTEKMGSQHHSQDP